MLLKSLLILLVFCLPAIKSQNEIDSCDGLSRADDFQNPEKLDGALTVISKIDKNGEKFETTETLVPSEDPKLRRGTLKTTKDNSDVIYSYFFDTNEYFKTNGYSCQSSDVVKIVILEDATKFVPQNVININQDVFFQHLGPFSLLRLAFASKNDLFRVGQNSRKWRQCVKDQLSIEYTLNSGEEPTNVVIKMKTDKGVEIWTYTFEEIESDGSDADHAPIGRGCKRRNPTRPAVETTDKFEAEIVLVDNIAKPDGSTDNVDSETIRMTVYGDFMSVIAKSEDGQSEVRNVIDSVAGLAYLDTDRDTCRIETLLNNLEKDLKFPYTSKEQANLLSPTILNIEDRDEENQYSFEFLGTSDGNNYLIYERVIDDFYVKTDGSKTPAIVTQKTINKLKTPRGIEQKSSAPFEISIKVFENDKRQRVTKNIQMTYQTYSTQFTDTITRFNVRKCFKDVDVSTFRITFDADITKANFTRQKQDIIQAFIDKVQNNVSVVRLPRIDIIRKVDKQGASSFDLEGDLLKRPQPNLFFTKSEGEQITGEIVDKAKDENSCLVSCLDDNSCKGSSFCEDNKCYKSTLTATTASETCKTFLKQGFYQKRKVLSTALRNMVKNGFKISVPGLPDLVAKEYTSSINVDPNKSTFPDVEQMIEGQNAFSAHIEKLDIDKKTTTVYFETRDVIKKRGAVYRVVEDMAADAKYDRSLIFFYDTQEYFSLNGNDFTCNTTKIEKVSDILDSQNILPKVIIDIISEAGFQVIGPSILLDYGKDSSVDDSFQFEDISNYNGISNVKKWTLNNDEKKFKLDYYFYTADFGLSPIAVEVWLEGNKKFIYNFADFVPEVNVHRFESVPFGYGCKRLVKPDLPPPSFIREYKQTLELVMYKFGDKRTSKMQALQNAISVDSRLTVFVSRNNTPIPHPMRKVIDENINLMFTTDLFTGRCKIEPKPDTDFQQWPDIGMAIDYSVLDRRIFMLTDTFQNLGQAEERGVTVDVFETVIDDFSFSDLGQKMPAVITHFTPDIKTSIPMKIIVRVFNSPLRESVHSFFEVNVHNFQELTQYDQKEQLFDISNCFLSSDQQMWFQIQFVDDLEVDKLELMQRKKAIEASFRDLMENEYGIPPTRLPKVIVDESPQGVFITAKLLERPPFSFSFNKIEKKQMDETFGKEILISSEDKCGQKCYEDETCIGFSYCSNFECAPLYKESNLSLDKNLKDNVVCNAYSKIDPNATVGSGDSMIDSIMFMLQEPIINRKFRLQIPIIESSGTEDKVKNITLTASELKQNVEPGFSREYEERIHVPFVSKPTAFDISKELQRLYLINKRNRRLDFSKLGEISQKTVNIEIGDCKKLCDDNPLCKTFSYCTSNNECITSNLDADAVVNPLTTTSQSCSILSKYFIGQYEKSVGIEVKVAKEYIQVPSAEVCARSCSTETKFNCLSFDLCDDGIAKYCYLHTYHLFVNRNEANVSAKADCDHYSKKFTFNFTAAFNQKFQEVKVIESMASLTTEQCAHSCYNNDECVSFEFCEKVDGSEITNQCRTTSSAADSNSLMLSRGCIVYVKNSVGMREQQSNDDDKSGYNKGLAAFLAILLFVVGSALGVVAIWLFYNKFTARS